MRYLKNFRKLHFNGDEIEKQQQQQQQQQRNRFSIYTELIKAIYFFEHQRIQHLKI